MLKITPVILSGGSGTRLWPMSRDEKPKQFLALTDAKTMFQMTLSRTMDSSKFDAPLIVANSAHREIIEKQLAEQQISTAKLLLEPCARNTAPAIAIAALACNNPEQPMLVMPSDHVIADVESFHAAIQEALPMVSEGWLATFGITPTGPETGYGYIQMGETLTDSVREVDRFVEKPDQVAAEAMLADGGYSWNGGIFLFRADTYLTAMERYAPEMLSACRKSMEQAIQDGQAVLPDAEAFAASPSDSIDYAIMEKAEQVAVIPVSMGWSDVGSWDALYEIAPSNDAATSVDSSGNLVKSDGVRIHLAGVEDMIVVASGDDVVIVPRGQSQNVKKIAEAVKARR